MVGLCGAVQCRQATQGSAPTTAGGIQILLSRSLLPLKNRKMNKKEEKLMWLLVSSLLKKGPLKSNYSSYYNALSKLREWNLERIRKGKSDNTKKSK